MLSSIEEQGKLTEELKKQILEAQTLVVVEDLYRPYRPKRRTRATIAKEKGLEPLANIILLQMTDKSLEEGICIRRKRSDNSGSGYFRCKRYRGRKYFR